MNARTLSLRVPTRVAAFAALAVTVYSVELVLVRSALSAANPRAVGLGVALDLLVVVPLAYWLLVVRGGLAKLRTLLPVIALSLVGARLVVPPDPSVPLGVLRWALAPFELAVALHLGWKVRALLRRPTEADADVLDGLRRVLGRALGEGALAETLATELGLLWYALFSWRRAAHVPDGAQAFAHRGNGALAAGLSLAIVVESAVIHLVVAQRSPVLAWGLSFLGAYGLLWLLGDARALALRPLLVGNGRLLLRVGLRHQAEVPLRAIARVEQPSWNALPEKAADYLDAARPGEPNVIIHLREAIVVRSLFGRRRAVTRLGVGVLAPDALVDALETSRRPG